jgi:hypothetical protein
LSIDFFYLVDIERIWPNIIFFLIIFFIDQIIHLNNFNILGLNRYLYILQFIFNIWFRVPSIIIPYNKNMLWSTIFFFCRCIFVYNIAYSRIIFPFLIYKVLRNVSDTILKTKISLRPFIWKTYRRLKFRIWIRIIILFLFNLIVTLLKQILEIYPWISARIIIRFFRNSTDYFIYLKLLLFLMIHKNFTFLLFLKLSQIICVFINSSIE